MLPLSYDFVEVNGVSIHIARYDHFSGRPTIVFLHDSLGCVELWRDFPLALATSAQCNVLIYDRQGYGKSDPMRDHHRTKEYLEIEAETLHELLTQLNLSDVILFGHSDGGSIALIAAAKYPEKIKCLVVEAAHIFVEEVTLQGIRNAVELYKTTNLRTRLEKYHGDKTETLFRAWTETWLSEEFRIWSIVPCLNSISCPVLFIQGDKDEYGSIDQMTGVKEHVSGPVELQLIPGVGHTPHKEARPVVEQITKDFLRKTLM